MASRFTTNIGPGNIIGAMAVGEGAKVTGHVTIGGESAPARTKKPLRMKLEIRGAANRGQLSVWLEEIAESILDGNMTGATGEVVSGERKSGCAWTVEADE